MKVNIHDTFSPLQEVILGSVNYTVLDSIKDTGKRDLMTDVLDGTFEDLSIIKQTLESFGVTVLEPYADLDCGKNCVTPFFETEGSHIPLTPRDIFFAFDDTIVITASGDRTRLFEHQSYVRILNRYMDNGSRVISMPMPSLRDEVYQPDETVSDFFWYNNFEPLIDGAAIVKYGKDVLIGTSITSNPRGIRWIEREMGSQYRFHHMPAFMDGHLDAHFNILKPGVVLTKHPAVRLPDFFKGWTVINGGTNYTTTVNDAELISGNIQDDDFVNTNLDFNVFSIDTENALVFNWTPDSVKLELEKNKINPLPVPLRYCNILNQALTCITLDTVRKGVLEDYK